MKVAVVGAGMVGRLAAWAAVLDGHDVTLFDREADRLPTYPLGFVFLHEDCELKLTPQPIRVYHTGDADGYSRKVYGESRHPTSFGRYGELEGYSPKDALEALLARTPPVEALRFDRMEDVLALRYSFDRVVSTIPLRSLLRAGDYPSTVATLRCFPATAQKDLEENTCVYNGNPQDPWHRGGAMFGWVFFEYAMDMPTAVALHGQANPVISLVKVVEGAKPPRAKNVLLTGRYGAWRKMLMSESFREVLAWLGE
jgi:hypothetical protein